MRGRFVKDVCDALPTASFLKGPSSMAFWEGRAPEGKASTTFWVSRESLKGGTVSITAGNLTCLLGVGGGGSTWGGGVGCRISAGGRICRGGSVRWPKAGGTGGTSAEGNRGTTPATRSLPKDSRPFGRSGGRSKAGDGRGASLTTGRGDSGGLSRRGSLGGWPKGGGGEALA